VSTVPVWPDRLFDRRNRPDRVTLVDADGLHLHLDSSRWHAFASEADRDVLGRIDGPVLDVGCGPGRHVAELAQLGHDVMGIDTSLAAVASTTRRGGPAVHGSVFGPVPRAGEWGTVLLLDGNIGIGGDPVALLRRCGEILRPGGRVLVETEGPARPGRQGHVRIVPPDEAEEGNPIAASSPWFAWATVPAGRIDRIATTAGYRVMDLWCVTGRWFAELWGDTNGPR
jgi:SAM-dependent methyltransferase